MKKQLFHDMTFGALARSGAILMRQPAPAKRPPAPSTYRTPSHVQLGPGPLQRVARLFGWAI